MFSIDSIVNSRILYIKLKNLTGVIAAAGKGTRAYPKTTFIPKPLFRIEGKSILAHNVDLLINRLKVKKIYVLVGHLSEQVTREVEELAKTISVPIETAQWTTKGLASDVASLENRIDGPFALILGDEFYYKSNHEKFLATLRKYPKLTASIGVTPTSLINRIRKNYSVELQGDKIRNLIEKPEDPPNDLLGLGSYLFTPEYFRQFHQTPPSAKSGVVEITEVIDNMAKKSGKVYATKIDCNYFNINSMQDFHQAVYEIRNDRFKNYKISVVVPTENNERSIADILVDFRDKVDEVLLVDAGSTDATRALAKKFRARVMDFVKPARGGYLGDQVRSGIDAASGDLVIVLTPDGSYRSKDFAKFLEYLKDSDMVIGTRTTRQMIEQGANLNPSVRLVNLVIGKLIEVFWWGQEPRFTDADCRYFGVWKDSWGKVSGYMQEKGNYYIAEMMIDFVRAHLRVIEIPVSYYKPVEQDRYTFRQSLREAWHVFRMILRKKFSNY